ncbi:hypothetical protein [Spodoptera cosmioides nucleopolyhedrovirus]|uniref:Uncharacterized protein n=1 Tax=Spodoptera cosmioides nucleopolyhedrovirus TaxID=2605774 RepID=A0A6B7KT19_9ABAC|nr:hypothetical protein [Spodoptera cosmioides nucleopolyhedrovirus]
MFARFSIKANIVYWNFLSDNEIRLENNPLLWFDDTFKGFGSMVSYCANFASFFVIYTVLSANCKIKYYHYVFMQVFSEICCSYSTLTEI